MIKELYKSHLREIKANVTANSIDSIRKKDILKSGCRVYDGKYFGVAGVMGEPTAETWAQAERNLSLKLSYTYEPSGNATRERKLGGELNQKKFIADCERLLSELSRLYPDMNFSNLIRACEITDTIENDSGLHYLNRDVFYNVSLTVKHRDSKSVFDTGIGISTRGDFVAEMLESAAYTLGSFNTPAALPESKKVLLALPQEYLGELVSRELDAERLARGASILSGKLGSKIFGDNFTLFADLSEENYGQPFFDAEGSVLPGDKKPIIQNGVLLRGFADKRNAAEYNTENTASAAGTYDNMPSCSETPLRVEHCRKTLAEMLRGKTAIWVDSMNGGDCTNEGQFASPVQMAYLMQGADLVGRLPEFGVTFSLCKALGEGFVGVSSDKIAGYNIAVFEAEID